MSESHRTQIPKRKRLRTPEEETPSSSPLASDPKRDQKLKELDEFMESVLEKAGEEFLEEFKQVEGE